ncbi:MAG: hypothetical protein LBJ12_01490 [Oscillospiraceae bacterium]|nr:hypothetical protein [Oscillospiraceae bacterium]
MVSADLEIAEIYFLPMTAYSALELTSGASASFSTSFSATKPKVFRFSLSLSSTSSSAKFSATRYSNLALPNSSVLVETVVRAGAVLVGVGVVAIVGVVEGLGVLGMLFQAANNVLKHRMLSSREKIFFIVLRPFIFENLRWAEGQPTLISADKLYHHNTDINKYSVSKSSAAIQK